jgi:uncharacterized protein (DUF2249 family)
LIVFIKKSVKIGKRKGAIMTITHGVPGFEHAGTAAPAAGSPPARLTGQDAQLLEQVAIRVADLVKASTAGRWPARELQGLVGYLQAEVLRQAEDEEGALFPAQHTLEGFARLARDHVRLRAGIEALAQASAGEGACSHAQLAATAQDVLAQLKRHLTAKERALMAAVTPGTESALTGAARRRHEWYPLTEGPVADLDALPPGEMTDAAVDRLLRLRRGEQVELRSGRDPAAIWRRMDELYSAGYGFVYLQDGPDRWRMQVTRRPG